MKRKIIALISVLALSFSVFAFSVSAVEGEESGGESLTVRGLFPKRKSRLTAQGKAVETAFNWKDIAGA